MKNDELRALLAEHMEGGFLENIIDMFKHDRGLYGLVPELMSDERSRVRIGTVALVEALRREHARTIDALAPAVGPLLAHENPAVRADAAYLLGIIGGQEAVALLEAASDDEVEPVRQVIAETLQELKNPGF